MIAKSGAKKSVINNVIKGQIDILKSTVKSLHLEDHMWQSGSTEKLVQVLGGVDGDHRMFAPFNELLGWIRSLPLKCH